MNRNLRLTLWALIVATGANTVSIALLAWTSR